MFIDNYANAARRVKILSVSITLLVAYPAVFYILMLGCGLTTIVVTAIAHTPALILTPRFGEMLLDVIVSLVCAGTAVGILRNPKRALIVKLTGCLLCYTVAYYAIWLGMKRINTPAQGQEPASFISPSLK
ncbi:hypothetical protein ES708_32879 [subsurface metagenome]